MDHGGLGKPLVRNPAPAGIPHGDPVLRNPETDLGRHHILPAALLVEEERAAARLHDQSEVMARMEEDEMHRALWGLAVDRWRLRLDDGGGGT